MKIWLPDDEVGISVDVSQTNEERCTLYSQRFNMTLQPIPAERGFALPAEKGEK